MLARKGGGSPMRKASTMREVVKADATGLNETWMVVRLRSRRVPTSRVADDVQHIIRPLSMIL
jgi:hypothetical protein